MEACQLSQTNFVDLSAFWIAATIVQRKRDFQLDPHFGEVGQQAQRGRRERPTLWERPAGGEADEEFLTIRTHGPGDRDGEGDVWGLGMKGPVSGGW